MSVRGVCSIVTGDDLAVLTAWHAVKLEDSIHSPLVSPGKSLLDVVHLIRAEMRLVGGGVDEGPEPSAVRKVRGQ